MSYNCSKDVEVNDYRILPPTSVALNQKKNIGKVQTSILDTYRTSHEELMQPEDVIVEDTITNLSEIKPIKNNAFTAIPNQLKAWKNLTKDKIIPKPSKFFKIGRLKNLDLENKTIRLLSETGLQV